MDDVGGAGVSDGPWRERVVGFDVRVAPDVSARAWDAGRRVAFLLRPEATAPLSVDPAVWPRPDGAIEAPSPSSPPVPDGAVGVAITVWVGPGQPDVGTLPFGPDPGWTLLGWDVADGVCPSALTNCGFLTEGEAAAWRSAWGFAVDPEHHLVQDLPTAFALQAVLGRRVPEHAPFSVFGVYLCPPR